MEFRRLDTKAYKGAVNLKLSFVDEDLECWRILSVPAAFTLSDLHSCIQAMMDWLDYHLHYFYVDEGPWHSVYFANFAEIEDGILYPQDDTVTYVTEKGRVLFEQEVKVADAFAQFKTLTYIYDLGDNWEMKLELLSRDEFGTQDEPLLLQGAGQQPVEDCGGSGGWEVVCAIADKRLSKKEKAALVEGHYGMELEDFLEWMESQNYYRFTMAAARKRLAHWKSFKRSHEQVIREVFGSLNE